MLVIQDWPRERVRPDPNNPRRHSAEQLEKIAASIAAFGFNNPILVDPAGVIIAGEARLAAAAHLDLPTVPVVVLGHLSEIQRRAYAVADNRLALDAQWDEGRLATVLRELDAFDFDLGVVGFSDGELDALLGVVAEAALPELPSGDRAPFQQMTFTLHDDQVATVKSAVAKAKQAGPFEGSPNENSNGNALARICHAYLEGGDVG